jgi:excisionase family DNA binding protein
MSAPEYLSVQEAADLLRVNHKTVRAEVRRGRLPALQVGTVLRIPRAALDERLAYNSTPAASGTRYGSPQSRPTGEFTRRARGVESPPTTIKGDA